MKTKIDSTLNLPSPSRRKTLSFAGLGLTGAALAIAPGLSSAAKSTAPASSTKPLKILLHVSDADGWPAALSNVRNLTIQHPKATVRVVADGSGVYMMQGTTDITPLFQKYAGLGVEFQACHNALNEKHISPTSLASGIKVVPSGVIAIVESQYDDFAYIKP